MYRTVDSYCLHVYLVMVMQHVMLQGVLARAGATTLSTALTAAAVSRFAISFTAQPAFFWGIIYRTVAGFTPEAGLTLPEILLSPSNIMDHSQPHLLKRYSITLIDTLYCKAHRQVPHFYCTLAAYCIIETSYITISHLPGYVSTFHRSFSQLNRRKMKFHFGPPAKAKKL